MKPREDALRSKLRWTLVALTALVYWHVSSYGFINYDDARFVSQNPHVYTGLSAANTRWAFTTLNGDATSYQPLTWLSHQIDCQFFGLQPGVHHLTNLWLHITNSVLLFLLLDTLTRKVLRSALVAALFALHPLHIETVAWISERKSLLCVFFWLLATLMYVRYARNGGVWNYVSVLVLFAAALLSKPIAVSLPITLLLLDFWPLERLHFHAPFRATRLDNSSDGAMLGPPDGPIHLRDRCDPGSSNEIITGERKLASNDFVAEAQGGRSISGFRGRFFALPLLDKLPLLLLSGAISWVTVLAQNALHATRSLRDVSMALRLQNSVVASILYLRKTVWPNDLAPIYPLRRDWPWWQVASCGILLLAISVWAVSQARKRRYLITGWLWFLVTLFPTIGIIQVGSQSMADRYSYVPLIGVFWLVVWRVSDWAADNAVPRSLLSAGACGLVIACGVSTFLISAYWENSILLFQHAVRVTAGNNIAYRQLGMALIGNGALPEAEALFRQALNVARNDFLTETYLADVLSWEGKSEEAQTHYSQALKINPSAAYVHCRLAEFCLNTKDRRFRDPARALHEARTACELSHYNNRKLMIDLALIAAENHQFQEASNAAQKAIELSIGPTETRNIKQMLAKIREP